VAVSKRLRFEVLRRDGFRCRYCGHTAAQTELRVDHVVAEALGGTDEPANLVTACEPCNSGKSATPLDAATVAEVSADAERWAAAIAEAARRRSDNRADVHKWFTPVWYSASDGYLDGYDADDKLVVTGGPSTLYTQPDELSNVWSICAPPRPDDWLMVITNFLAAGLDRATVGSLVTTAMQSRARREDKWRYFCGCCWNQIRDLHAAARELLNGIEARI
jgi:hypothetical protein